MNALEEVVDGHPPMRTRNNPTRAGARGKPPSQLAHNVGQESIWEQGQGLFKKRAQNLLLCTGQGLCGAQAPPGIAPGHTQAPCPCWLFQETKPPHSHHIGPLTLNTCIPKGPPKRQGCQSKCKYTGKLTSKKPPFSAALEEEDKLPMRL